MSILRSGNKLTVSCDGIVVYISNLPDSGTVSLGKIGFVTVTPGAKTPPRIELKNGILVAEHREVSLRIDSIPESGTTDLGIGTITVGQPTLLQKAVSYVEALAANGLAARPKEEVERIYSICSSCDFFKTDSCSICGCRINRSSSPILNKIAAETQHCPIGKW